MRKILLTGLVALAFSGLASAQTSFFDDFEAYNNGDYVAQNNSKWTTWSNKPGTTEDGLVSNEKAYSGTNALRLYSASTSGGPTDLILPFGAAPLNAGVFNYEMYYYVPAGNGGYFNFQSVKPLGTDWAVSVYIYDNGTWAVTNGDDQVVYSKDDFKYDTWVKFRLTIDLTNAQWQVYIDDNLEVSFVNPSTSVYAIDLYPVNSEGTALMYVDDVKFVYEPAVLPSRDASMINVAGRSRGLVGQEFPITGKIRNTGTSTINSFKVTVENGSEVYEGEFTGLDIKSLDFYTFTMTDKVNIQQGLSTMKATVKDVNASGDDDDDFNNINATQIRGYLPAQHKGVLVEEGTGTWCGYCPRGAVFMDSLSHLYPGHFVPVAVHNADPMTVTDYDAGVGAFPGFTGYPGAIVNRVQVVDPSGVEDPFLPAIEEATIAKFTNGAAFNAATRELKFSVTIDALEKIAKTYKLMVVVTQDSVKHTSSGYRQSNYYANNALGWMGGFEKLPAVVPANQMRYDHVARLLYGGFKGTALTRDVDQGSTYSVGFSTILPDSLLEHKLNIVAVLFKPDGTVENATTFTFDEALANGLISTKEEIKNTTDIKIAPNPFSQSTNVSLNLVRPVDVQINLYNALGTMVVSKKYGVLNGINNIPLVTGSLPAGVYNLQINAGGELLTQKVVVTQ